MTDLFRGIFPYLELINGVAPRVIRLALGESTVQKSTECDTKSTDHDTKSTDHDILTTLGDIFTTLCARREFRLTSNRLRFFDFGKSCG